MADEGIELLGSKDDHMVGLAETQPALGGSERSCPAGFVADLGMHWSAYPKRRDDMAEWAVEHGLGKEDGTGKTASLLVHIPVKSGRVDKASEKKRGDHARAREVDTRSCFQSLGNRLDHEVGDGTGPSQAWTFLPAQQRGM